MACFRSILLALNAAAFLAAAAPPTFPLRIDKTHRHLIDSHSRPFLFTADTAWALFYRLAPADADVYLRDRESKGFSAILVQLLSEDPGARTTDEISPLLETGRLDRPNARFFEHAVCAVKVAQKHHLLVAIAPVWLGCCKGGWRDALLAAGPAKARELGRYIGRQFAALPNVMWILGGDHDPDQYYAVVDALARGIREEAPHQLMMAHAGSPHSAADVYRSAPWLDVNTTYTYSPEITSVGRTQFHVYAACLRDYNRTPTRPFVLLETAYENERNSTPQMIRRQAYWSVLTGSTGQAMGNLPIYLFRSGWREALNSTASEDMSRLAKFFADLPWYTWVPDHAHRYVVRGYGTFEETPAKDRNHKTGFDYVTASVAPDGSSLAAYLPARNTIEIDTNRLKHGLQASWYDPTDGSFRRAVAYPRAQGIDAFTPPWPNHANDSDWLLVIR